MSRPIVVDTSALIAILRNEPDANLYIDELAARRGNVLISAGTWMEALMVAAHRRPSDGVKRLRELGADIELQVEPVDQVMSEVAYIGWQQFGKANHPARLNYGDCFSYGLARAYDLRLLYKGDDFSQTDVAGVL